MAHSSSLSLVPCFHTNSISTFLSKLPKSSRATNLPSLPTLPPLSVVATDFLVVNGATVVAIGGGSVATLAAVLSLTDPERRRRLQAKEVGGGDKDVVKKYFNNSGFQRWKKIYRDTDDVNRVQRDIRLGHSKTVENLMAMLKDEGPLRGVTVCDAGCGTRSFSIPVAREGAIVYASDFSAAMVVKAKKQAEQKFEKSGDEMSTSIVMPKFQVNDLKIMNGKYDTVECLDVLIHYTHNKADDMIAHLASLAEKRLIISFAPKTFYYDLLKRVGELFPGPSKATRAYLHSEADVERALQKVGWRIRKRVLITTQVYFARLVKGSSCMTATNLLILLFSFRGYLLWDIHCQLRGMRYYISCMHILLQL